MQGGLVSTTNTGQFHTMTGASGASGGNTARPAASQPQGGSGLETSVDVTQMGGLPAPSELLPENWDVDELNAALLGLNTLFLAAAVYYSYQGIR